MMPNSNEVGKSSLDTPRSPLSSSTDSSRRGSLRVLQPEKNYEPPTPGSPPIRLTRKRAASLDFESANHPRIGDLALNSGIPNQSLSEQVCLCQPDPKIPRPRNAFILYRQHYQAQVVAQHPGLANPEISKIIGEQWRSQDTGVKAEWKRLAEEEKQRHQRQYPGYRYQPRRAGKTNGIHPASSITADGPIRCPKCNGRYISTPSTPLTPYAPAFGGLGIRTERLPPPFPSSRIPEENRSRFSSFMEQPRMDSPRMAPPPQQMLRRSQFPPTLDTHHEQPERDPMSPTPDQKRRRFHDTQQQQQRAYSISSPSSYAAPQQAFARNGPLPLSAGGYTSRQHLPGPAMIARQGVVMGPPQPSPLHSRPPPSATIRHQYPTRSNTFDESLRLPPLQTQMPPTPTSSQRSQLEHNNHNTRSETSSNISANTRESQARSIEAMVMTIPYMTKIHILKQISPPLAAPSPTSPAQETRGAVIVVEGHDKSLLAEVGVFITETLQNDPSCAVRTWDVQKPGSKSEGGKDGEKDTVMADAGKSTSADPSTTISQGSTSLSIMTDQQAEKNPFVDYLSIIADMHQKSAEIVKYITTIPTSTTDASTTTIQTPIALLPTGFSLTTSDTHALLIPINDSYAPVDHWQWMATLWRGIVGPDLTVIVNRVSREEFGRLGAVEVRAEVRGVVVRVCEGGLDEKTKRRLGFEVLEWVRGRGGDGGGRI